MRLAAGTGALLAAPALHGCKKKRVAASASAAGRPRYVVQLLLSGGHDPVYTTDPKERREVEADIDLPVDGAITEAAGLRLGPSFAPLRPHARELAFLNGVEVGTANHDTGLKQFLRLKTNASSKMPGALDLIGAERDGQPLGVAYLGLSQRVLHSPGFFGSADGFYLGPDAIFDRAFDAEPEELGVLAEVLRGKAGELEGAARLDPRARVTQGSYRDAAAFFARVAGLDRFETEVRAADYTEQSMSASMDRALWLLENDLCRCAFLDLGLLGWDTHIENPRRQQEMNGAFVTHFRRFLARLGELENEHGRLADNTVVVAGSDLGRFPRLNDMRGKDHLPQTAFFFAGPGLAGGRSFGGTGKRMEALRIDPATGATARGGHRTTLDDVGTTLLRLAGLEPERYGYTGRTLDFLLDA